MEVLNVRNAHEALPRAVDLLLTRGLPRGSRNGEVIRYVNPVTTVYHEPMQRVVFWHERDANPFFHLYESLWMLAGRADLAPLLRYVKDFGRFSDDGDTLHGAYGCRWRQWFSLDQLPPIMERLRADADDRRCVLQIWDAVTDLNRVGKDVPCNVAVTFQRHPVSGALDMVVFNRSNDVIWGAYGANAVHFGFLLEYMALGIGCAPGTYTQVSVNWHAYVETLKQVASLAREAHGLYSIVHPVTNPYHEASSRWPKVRWAPLGTSLEAVDRDIAKLLEEVENGFKGEGLGYGSPFFVNAEIVLHAHHLYSMHSAPLRFGIALERLGDADQTLDWVVAAREWFERREAKWKAKQ